MAEGLLAVPTAESEAFQKVHTRSSCRYENLCARYRLENRDYVTQYAHIYYTRLESMRRYLRDAAVKKWGDEVVVKKSLLEAGVDERCCVIGTLFKKMELKPSILKEISANHHLLPQPPRAKATSSSDQLVVEDKTQRIALCGNIPPHEMVTGVVVALLGRQLKRGSFEVEDYTFAGLAPQEQSMEDGHREEERCVLLVSGLGIGSSWCDRLSMEMLVDYVTGQLGGAADQQMCSRIVRVVIAGNSITHKPTDPSNITKDKRAKFQSRNYSARTIEAVKEMDDVLSQLTSCVAVDLMPGSHDPANHQLPQQPLNPCMFPQSRATGNLKSLTNPYHSIIGRTRFIGCSGQNIDDIYKFSSLTDRLQILENTLHWRHLLPTSPDTLSCYPYKDKDPFILEDCPHVFFSGNQPSFQSRVVRGSEGQAVLLVCVPTFDLTHSAVLVTLRAGESEAQEISFTTSLSHAPNPHLEEVLAMEAGQDQGEEPSIHGDMGRSEVTLLHLMDDDDDD